MDAGIECIVDKVVHARVLAATLALGAVLEKVGALELKLALCSKGRHFNEVFCVLLFWEVSERL